MPALTAVNATALQDQLRQMLTPNQTLSPEQQQALQDRYQTTNDDGTLNRGTVTPFVPGAAGNLTNATQLAKSYTQQFQGMDQEEVRSRLQDDPTYKWLIDNNWLKSGDGGQPQLGNAYQTAMSSFMTAHPTATFRQPNYDSTDTAHYEGGIGAVDPVLGGYHEGGKFVANKESLWNRFGEILPYLAAAGMTAGAGAAVGAVSGGASGFNLFNVPGLTQSLSNLGGGGNSSSSSSSGQSSPIQMLLQLLSRYRGTGG
jgi:hypothetical protein